MFPHPCDSQRHLAPIVCSHNAPRVEWDEQRLPVSRCISKSLAYSAPDRRQSQTSRYQIDPFSWIIEDRFRLHCPNPHDFSARGWRDYVHPALRFTGDIKHHPNTLKIIYSRQDRRIIKNIWKNWQTLPEDLTASVQPWSSVSPRDVCTK